MFGYRYNPMVPIPLPELEQNQAQSRMLDAGGARGFSGAGTLLR
jgi:hypothetical protein